MITYDVSEVVGYEGIQRYKLRDQNERKRNKDKIVQRKENIQNTYLYISFAPPPYKIRLRGGGW